MWGGRNKLYVHCWFSDIMNIASLFQSMWEDKNTATKWVMVNQCYFPGDLPESVGRPCGLESSEVTSCLFWLCLLVCYGANFVTQFINWVVCGVPFIDIIFLWILQVYESTCSRSVMASLIEGPCDVLPPRKFAEESDRRIRSGRQINDHLPPLYLCKWVHFLNA